MAFRISACASSLAGISPLEVLEASVFSRSERRVVEATWTSVAKLSKVEIIAWPLDPSLSIEFCPLSGVRPANIGVETLTSGIDRDTSRNTIDK